MKIPTLAITALAALALHAPAMEKRTFWNVDKTKSFVAVPIGYDADKDQVIVRQAGGRTLRFKLDLLSKEDRQFIREHGDALAAANGIQIDFDMWEGERKTSRTDTERTVTTPAGYEITLENRTDTGFENVDVQYSIFHRKDAENGPGSVVHSDGVFTFENLFANYSLSERTEEIELVRYSRKKSGGG